jgi:hypothetical protein
MTDDRSDRLRKRREAAKSTAKEVDVDESSQSDEASETSEPSKPSEPSKLSKQEDGSVKDQQKGTYMYLPESQHKELSRLYNVLKAEYEYEYEREFQKNRHFYPLVIKYGLDGLDSLDAEGIKERLQHVYQSD